MKEVDKKDPPQISGGYADPSLTDTYVTDPSGCVPDFPSNPMGPLDQTVGERDLPSPRK
jgi:hypothetical protein